MGETERRRDGSSGGNRFKTGRGDGQGRKEGRKFQPFPPFTVNADREQRQKQRVIFSKQSIARG